MSCKHEKKNTAPVRPLLKNIYSNNFLKIETETYVQGVYVHVHECLGLQYTCMYMHVSHSFLRIHVHVQRTVVFTCFTGSS